MAVTSAERAEGESVQERLAEVEAALRNLVQWYARRKADSNELLPVAEQPVEIRQAMAALRDTSLAGELSIGAEQPHADHVAAHGVHVPKVLRDLVDEIGGDLMPGRSWHKGLHPGHLFSYLKDHGAEKSLADDRDGRITALAEFKLDGRTWLLWVEGDCCGVEPCISLAAAVMAGSYGKLPCYAQDCYRWTYPESHT